MTLFIRGEIRPEEKNPVSRFLHKIYEPVAHLAIRFRKTVIVMAIIIIMALTVYHFMKLGTEFMPPLYEGSLFYMPVTMPGASATEAARLLKMQDELLMKIPEVAQVFGKAGRAETATDPAPLVGSFWFLYLLNYNMSIAVWVGIIALAGLDAETGVIMLLYLDLAYEKWKKEGKLTTKNDIQDAIMFGAVKRIRPKIMTVSVILAGLIPIMFSAGTGADVMKRIAAPMVGGVITSTILELIIYPAIYMIWRIRGLNKD